MRSYLPVIVILVLIALGALVLVANNKSGQPVDNTAATVTQSVNETTPSPTDSSSGSTQSAATNTSPTPKAPEQMITVGDKTANPATLTVSKGTVVTWVNAGKSAIDVRSNPHPEHTDYPALNGVGTIAAGNKKSMTFNEAGTYGWHNHLNTTVKGTITVK